METAPTFKQLVDLSDDCVKELDLDGRIVAINAGGVVLLRAPNEGALIGQDWVAMWPEAFQAVVRRGLDAAREGQRSRFIAASENPDGSLRWWSVIVGPLRDADGHVFRLGGISREVTERVHLEQSLDTLNDSLRHRLAAAQRSVDQGARRVVALQDELALTSMARGAAEHVALQAQKGEAVGQVVAGMGHDLNNHLQTILSALDVLSDLSPLQARYVGFAQQAAHHAALMSRRMLAFSRTRPHSPDYVDLAEVVADVFPLMESTVRRGTSITLDPAPAPLLVFADGHEVQQALMNVGLNARDACEAGGSIRVSFGEVHVAPDASSASLQDGDYVYVDVTDSGPGMSDDVKERLFQPFFTTKPEGTSSGLGLAQVLGLMRQAGGAVEVESSLGAGTRVRLLFPKTRELAVA